MFNIRAKYCLCFIFAALFLCVSNTIMAAPYCDPQADMSCYRTWCSEQGGTVDTSAGVACVGATGGGGSYDYSGSGTPYLTKETMAMTLAAGAMQSFSQGLQQGMERNRQIQLQNERDSLQFRRQAEAKTPALRAQFDRQVQEQLRLRDAKQTKQTQDLNKSRQRILGQMKGSFASAKQLPELKVSESEDSVLGIKQLIPDAVGRYVPTDMEERSACASYLLNITQKTSRMISPHADASLIPKLKEAAFLSGQAGRSIDGEDLDVDCIVSDVGEAGPIAESQIIAARLSDKAKVYEYLFNRTAEAIKNKATIQAQVMREKENVNQAQQNLKKADEKVIQLEEKDKREESIGEDLEEDEPDWLQAAKDEVERAEKNLLDQKEKLNAELAKNEIIKQNFEKTRVLFAKVDEGEEPLDEIIKDLGIE
jgi:hypothetical protein